MPIIAGATRGEIEEVGGSGPKAGAVDGVGGDAQAVGVAVGEAAGALDVGDARVALGGHAVDRLAAGVDRRSGIGALRAAVGVDAGDGQAQEHAGERLAGRGRAAAAVLAVAGRAGAGVEGGAEAVAAGGGVAGATTQFLLKKELPTAKRSAGDRCSCCGPTR
jgi:hypothetical protein